MTEFVIVPAGAGAGKTYRIQKALSEWVSSGEVRPERILAVTFTEAAANELKQRIRTELIANGDLQSALAVDRAYVSTIHGLGRRLLVEHAFAGGLSPQQRLITDDEQGLLIRRAIEQTDRLQELSRRLTDFGYSATFYSDSSQEDDFRGRLLGLIALLRNLGDRGVASCLADNLEVQIRADYGPVRGKASALGDALYEAVSGLLKSFPDCLDGVMSSAAAKKECRKNFQDLNAVKRNRRVLDTDWNLWNRLRTLRCSKRGAPTPEGYDAAADAVMVAAEKLLHHPGPLADAILHAREMVVGAQEVLLNYQERKQELGVIDFSDMVASAAKLLDENEGVLNSVLGEIDCVIVDEFQDTNPMQFAFLWSLARQGKHTLLVGDTKQAIMAFQGADPRLTEALVDRFKLNINPLEQNFRSDPRIMEFVNAVGAQLFEGSYQPLAAARKCGTDTALEVLTIGVSRNARKGPRPQHFTADRIASLLNDEDVEIIDRHSGLSRPLEPRDIAILCPTHKYCQNYATPLRALGIPVCVSEEGWGESRIVQAATFAVGYALDPNDRHYALCFATLGPPQVPLDIALNAIVDDGAISHPLLDELSAMWPRSLGMPVDRLVHEVITRAGLRDWCNRLESPGQARANLLRFEAEASTFMEAHRDMREASGFYGQSGHVFLGWLENKSSERDFDKLPQATGSRADGVEIVTWHASKGREWPIVVVAGLDHNQDPRAGCFDTSFPGFDNLEKITECADLSYVPLFAAREVTDRYLEKRRPEAIKTCKRLLYVALTRARERLIVEWPLVKEKPEEEIPPVTGYRILLDECGFAASANTATVGGSSFSVRQSICGEEMPAVFASSGQHGLEPEVRLRDAIERRAMPKLSEALGPSRTLSTELELPSRYELLQIGPGVQIPVSSMEHASDRGTAVHEALRILLLRSDLKERAIGHCRLDQNVVDPLAEQAEGLCKQLAARGFDKLHVEQPINILLPDGGRLTAIIDLMAEGSAGIVIVDHKSGPVSDHQARFHSYWPQLASYISAIDALDFKPVVAAAIMWTDTGAMTWADFDKQFCGGSR